MFEQNRSYMSVSPHLHGEEGLSLLSVAGVVLEYSLPVHLHTVKRNRKNASDSS